MNARARVFVAYPMGDTVLAQTVLDAVRRANAVPQAVNYEPWQFNDISGTPVISPILEKIHQAPFIVADITYLNLNVVYEVGFAIGRCKRAFLVRNEQIQGDRGAAVAVGIFDTLGYHQYNDAEELKDRLTAHIDETPISFSTALDRKSPVYLIDPPFRERVGEVMVSCIRKAGYGRYRSFTPDEDSRLSAVDAICQVAVSSGVFIPLQETTVEGSTVHNVRCMFVAGLADGMGKPKLLLAPSSYQAPVDVRDDVKTFSSISDVAAAVAQFCPAIVEYSSQIEPSGIDRSTLLNSLTIGDPRAENEMTTLAHYYLKNDQYERALRGDVNLVVGRKGSGKTALFIRLRDTKRANKRNIVVDLQPEGYHLIKMKEDILSYLTDGARQHLVTAFWEYLILLEVAHKMLQKDQQRYKHNHEIYDQYIALKDAYYVEDFSGAGDFSERLYSLSQRLSEDYKS